MKSSEIYETEDRTKFASFLAIVAFIIYYSFILVAALFYPGGYDLLHNYYSDLGRTVALNGENNTYSPFFFILGTTVTGLLFVPFWLTYYSIFRHSNFTRSLGKLGSIFGMLAIPCLFGIAFIPINVFLDLHAIFSISYYLTISISLFCYSIAIILQPDYPNYNGLLGLFIVIFEILFIIGLFAEIEPLVQKITSLCFAFWIILQFLTIRKAVV